MEEILELQLINDLEFNTKLDEEHIDLPSEQDSTIEEVEQITCPHCGEKFTI